MIEIWKDIKGYDGIYQISNFGRVRSVDRVVYGRLSYKNGRLVKGKLLSLRKGKEGYVRVNLNKDGIKTTYDVHKLVADAFMDNPSNLPQINHKDENKTNNHVGNLEYCDSYYNTNYGTRNARISNSLKHSTYCQTIK